MNTDFIIGSVQINELTVPQVTEKLVFKDYLGAIMVRWGINRNNYRVNPGLCAIGTPDKSSDVFVTANYKLSFDHLRKNLAGINGWILVLDTKGINVWCAAGISKHGFSMSNSVNDGLKGILNVFLAYCSGVVITPALLPFIPFRRFAMKGFVAGILLSFILLFMNKIRDSLIENISWFLMISAISSFLAMNFTGSSTFTSLSGVKKEMKTAVPLQITFIAVGIILMIIGKLL